MMPDGGENRVEKGLWTLISEQSDIPKTFLGSTWNTTQNSITIGPAGPVLDAPSPGDNLEHHLREALPGRGIPTYITPLKFGAIS